MGRGHHYGIAEPDADCPVSLELLGQLYREDAATVADTLESMSEDRRIRLALFCYARAHLRSLAMLIAGSCDPVRMRELAGNLGQVLAVQCKEETEYFGRTYGASYAKAKISLSGTSPSRRLH